LLLQVSQALGRRGLRATARRAEYLEFWYSASSTWAYASLQIYPVNEHRPTLRHPVYHTWHRAVLRQLPVRTLEAAGQLPQAGVDTV